MFNLFKRKNSHRKEKTSPESHKAESPQHMIPAVLCFDNARTTIGYEMHMRNAEHPSYSEFHGQGGEGTPSPFFDAISIAYAISLSRVNMALCMRGGTLFRYWRENSYLLNGDENFPANAIRKVLSNIPINRKYAFLILKMSRVAIRFMHIYILFTHLKKYFQMISFIRKYCSNY